MVSFVRGDKGIDLVFVIVDPDLNAVDITGATVKFKMLPTGGSTLKIDATCTISDGPNGKCTYTLVATDLNISGDFFAELEVAFSGGTKIQTAKLENIRIEADLGSLT